MNDIMNNIEHILNFEPSTLSLYHITYCVHHCTDKELLNLLVFHILNSMNYTITDKKSLISMLLYESIRYDKFESFKSLYMYANLVDIYLYNLLKYTMISNKDKMFKFIIDSFSNIFYILYIAILENDGIMILKLITDYKLQPDKASLYLAYMLQNQNIFNILSENLGTADIKIGKIPVTITE